MAKNKPEKPFVKGDPRQSKGGKNKLGYKSLKTIMKEILSSGEIDPKNFVKAHMMHAMKGNSGIARLMWEYHEGKVKDSLELTGKDGEAIETVTLDKKEYEAIRRKMIESDDV